MQYSSSNSPFHWGGGGGGELPHGALSFYMSVLHPRNTKPSPNQKSWINPCFTQVSETVLGHIGAIEKNLLSFREAKQVPLIERCPLFRVRQSFCCRRMLPLPFWVLRMCTMEMGTGRTSSTSLSFRSGEYRNGGGGRRYSGKPMS